ncbi:hypothetical protein [Paraburkholderia mimosarum]|uniref:hypothetical protein n=1 Tax=Paraburkholderia mimosarum TaxID=312026 RepID=UPI0004166772|nr:hypothetical protein [Paraburkholderia mimosarum]
MFAKFFQRLQEPSTHAALASLVGAAGVLAVKGFGVDPATAAGAATVAQTAFGLLGVFMKEGA